MSGLVRGALKALITRLTSPLSGIYQSFDDAVRACSSEGYGDPDLVAEVARKTRLFRDLACGDTAPIVAPSQAMLGAALALTAGRTGLLTVIDFGGACGAHAFLARRLVGSAIHLAWHVVETDSMVAAARTVEPPSWLHFHNSLASAYEASGPLDLIYANNSIQYCRSPASVVESFVNLAPELLCFGRFAHCAVRRPVYTVQTSRLHDNGPAAGSDNNGGRRRIRYALTLCNLREISDIYRTSYRELMRMEDPTMLSLRGVGAVRYESLLLQKR